MENRRSDGVSCVPQDRGHDGARGIVSVVPRARRSRSGHAGTLGLGRGLEVAR